MNVAIQVAGEDFSSIARELTRWIDGILGRDYHRYHSGQTWSPSINLYEDSSCYYLVADLAGMEAEGIELLIENRRLILRGVRPGPIPPASVAERSEGKVAFRLHHMEIDNGPFHRTIELPASVDNDRVEAKYRNGFLWVIMPKK